MDFFSVGQRPVSVGQRFIGADEHPGKSSYFIGNDPAKWRTNVSSYAKVKIEDVYPGIDLVYYGNRRQLEYDWIVSPGADPGAIRFAVEGKTGLKVDSLQPASGGGGEAFVAKLNASGSALLYSTYLGGSGAAIANTPGEGDTIRVGVGSAYVRVSWIRGVSGIPGGLGRNREEFWP